tara:strand:- start:597 stop:1133 length:537 start_codon:yes stop_codon:yes gene_type:complete
MPIYEFYCEKTHKIYSFLSQRIIGVDEVPRCPDGEGFEMTRKVSAFSVTGRHKEQDDADGPDLDDPRLEAAMAELEGEMSGMDEENPDPRQMGKLMRRMSELTGEPLGGQMEEMVRKMEEGADLDALEEDFGDAMDDDGLDAPVEGGVGGSSALRQFLRARRKEPTKDPELYDWRDYA